MRGAGAGAAPAARPTAMPLRPCASAIRSSSSRPNSGRLQHRGQRQIVLRQRAARRRAPSDPARRSARSASAGRRRRRRCRAPSAPRPWPAANGARLRTRIRMSPARIGRPSRGQQLAAVEPAADGVGDARRRAAPGRARRVASAERRPRLGRLGRLVLLGRPDLDEAGVAGAVGDVADGVGRRRQARRALRVGEDGVDRGEQRRDRAERQRERNALPRQPAALGRAPRSSSPMAANMLRRGALEAVDRLLLVADGEQRARPARARPAPAKNSSASAVITCHCTGLVSCASSTRMWSRPPSSL